MSAPAASAPRPEAPGLREDDAPALDLPRRRAGAPSFAEDWRASYGPSWRMDLALLGAVVFIFGALQPLSDPDLPMHLATGEWIVRHGTVPFTEPFAWTRMGAPFYAYSWLIEVLFYLALRIAGPIGLHVLNGLLVLAAAASVIWLGYAARWKPWVALALAAFSLAIPVLVVESARPQIVLLIVVPLAWALTYRFLEAERVRWLAAGLVATSAVAANTHLFFVLTAVPVVLCWMRPPAQRWKTWLLLGCILGGWMLSPYALAWPRVFALNFGYNAMTVQPSPILELTPGFNAGFFYLVFAVPLLLVPWGLAPDELPKRDRLVFAALWLGGLVGFGMAMRLLLPWWLVTMPAAALALERAGRHERQQAPRRGVRIATYVAALLLLGGLSASMAADWRQEGGTATRRLPTPAAYAVDPFADWLDCHAPAAHGRVYTWFNYGSYVVWRMPGYSSSLDGRGVFPDSVAKIGALTSGWMAPTHYSTWSSADVAILPRAFGPAHALDASPDWALVAWDYAEPTGAEPVGLWVRRAWWQRAARVPLPDRVPLLVQGGANARAQSCASTESH